MSSSCFDAEVQYGDNPLERSLVTLKAEAGQQANTQVVRISSSANVDEAIVRLTLKAVCNPRASRSYTVLSDIASETATASATEQGAGRTSLPAPSAAPVAAPATANITQPAQAKAPSSPSTTNSKPAVRPALKLVPPVAKADENNRAKNALNASILEDLQRRVDEISKWQSSSSTADDLLKSDARAKALEADIQGLKAVTAKNQQNIQLVADALERGNASSYSLPLVYALGALLLASLAGLAYVLTRKRSGMDGAAPWWSGQDERARAAVAPGVAGQASVAPSQEHSLPAELQLSDLVPLMASTDNRAASSGTAPFAGGAAGTASVSATAVLPSGAAVSASAARAARPDFAPSAPGNLKSINTKEMLDVRQQAEFFMALGQHDEAVRLLETSIKGSAEYNPLVFLDLLKILHTLSRRADFERYREEFNGQFTGRIPAYSNFLREGNGLEAYEDICQQIVVLWPTEYTIDFIEQCLVRMPEDDPEQGMDLEAFRDLLLLYGILKRLDQGYDSNLAPFSTSRTESSQNAPLSAFDGGAATEPQPVAAASFGVATAPMDLDLDLDLDLSEEPAKPASQDNLIDFDMSAFMVEKNAGTQP